MESFEDIQKQEEAHLLVEIGVLGRRLVELGWSPEQVLAYVKQLLTEQMNTPTTHRKQLEDRMLTVEQMSQIVLEVGLGKPEKLHTPEANAFRKKMREETADIERQGLIVDLPAE